MEKTGFPYKKTDIIDRVRQGRQNVSFSAATDEKARIN